VNFASVVKRKHWFLLSKVYISELNYIPDKSKNTFKILYFSFHLCEFLNSQVPKQLSRNFFMYLFCHTVKLSRIVTLVLKLLCVP